MSQKTGSKPAAPKKPQGAYFIFMNEKREEFKKKFPDLSQQELIKQIAKAYKELNTEEKKQFEDKAHKQKEEYEKLKDEYVTKYGDIPKKGKEESENTTAEGRGRRKVKKTSSAEKLDEEGMDEEDESGKAKGKSKGRGSSKGRDQTTSEKLSEAGKKGAEARWGKRSKSSEKMAEETQESGQSPQNKGSKGGKSRSKSKENDRGMTTHQKLSEAGKKGAEARWGKTHEGDKNKGSQEQQQDKGDTDKAEGTQQQADIQQDLGGSNIDDQNKGEGLSLPKDSTIEQTTNQGTAILDEGDRGKPADIVQTGTDNATLGGMDAEKTGSAYQGSLTSGQTDQPVGQGDQNIGLEAIGEQKAADLGLGKEAQTQAQDQGLGQGDKIQAGEIDRPREEAQQQQLP